MATVAARATDSIHWVVVGLGNPWPIASRTSRHNFGLLQLERLANKLNATWKFSFSMLAYTANVEAGESRLKLVWPMVPYNATGFCIRKLLQNQRSSLEEWKESGGILVLHDDLDKPFFSSSFKNGGSCGGNNGLLSVSEAFGSNAFHRLRIGIGRPGDGKSRDPKLIVPYVLGKISEADEHKLIEMVLEPNIEAIIA
eukprot:CAMPEP_0184031428 /NCGR_PEP_ID=MMETSP0955-20130417/2235_1 /TAXON_ID=627963 /ORGANISM="Aplanochytrium sp, Strain PBS07" /LENGTH=197 /DNA_ID=CAMNT_0026317171 /DNA_START=39 /DNA_END=628 /DNA_ORIENTATION=+